MIASTRIQPKGTLFHQQVFLLSRRFWGMLLTGSSQTSVSNRQDSPRQILVLFSSNHQPPLTAPWLRAWRFQVEQRASTNPDRDGVRWRQKRPPGTPFPANHCRRATG